VKTPAIGKALIKDAVYYGVGATSCKAPCGEYTIDKDCDCVFFCTCNGERAFSLSLDAFLQHVVEGRIVTA